MICFPFDISRQTSRHYCRVARHQLSIHNDSTLCGRLASLLAYFFDKDAKSGEEKLEMSLFEVGHMALTNRIPSSSGIKHVGKVLYLLAHWIS
jgi:hypothetical protein